MTKNSAYASKQQKQLKCQTMTQVISQALRKEGEGMAEKMSL